MWALPFNPCQRWQPWPVFRAAEGSQFPFRFESLRPRTRTLRTPLAASAQLLHKFSHLAACLPHVCAYGPCTCVCVWWGVLLRISWAFYAAQGIPLKAWQGFYSPLSLFPPAMPFFRGVFKALLRSVLQDKSFHIWTGLDYPLSLSERLSFQKTLHSTVMQMLRYLFNNLLCTIIQKKIKVYSFCIYTLAKILKYMSFNLLDIIPYIYFDI